jgi:PKD domain
MEKQDKKARNMHLFSRSLTGKGVVLAIAMIFMGTAFSAGNLQNPESIASQKNMTLGITWDVTMNFNNPGGHTDYVVFGEAPDANDGPPADSYDIPEPPAPMPPYIRAYLKDNLPTPYNLLWMDYRQYPDSDKVWNLSVKWLFEDGGNTPTDITISWSSEEINFSEYNTVMLCDNSGNPLVNMKTTSHYVYTSPDDTTTQFKIRCSGTLPSNQPPLKPQIPSGEANGKINVEYIYTSSTTDPDGDQVSYWFDWGDGTNSGWVGPYASGAMGSANHKWSAKGHFNIKVEAKDVYGKESSWSDSLPVTMPYSYNKPILQFLELLFQRFPNVFPLLQQLVGY